MATEADRAALAEQISRLPVPEQIDVLRQILSAHDGSPENGLVNRWFLAVSTEYLGADDSEDRWAIEAVAYPDRDHYGGGHGPEPDLYASGQCPTCRIEVVSTAKAARCPRCGSPCLLT